MPDDNILNLPDEPYTEGAGYEEAASEMATLPELAGTPEEQVLAERDSGGNGDSGMMEERVRGLLVERRRRIEDGIGKLRAALTGAGERLRELSETGGAEEDTSAMAALCREEIERGVGALRADFEVRLDARRREIESEYEVKLEAARREAADREAALGAEMVAGREALARMAVLEEELKAAREAAARVESLEEDLKASREALALAVATAAVSETEVKVAVDERSMPGSMPGMKSAVEEIDQQRSQSGTLGSLVKQSANYAPRLIFFIVRRGTLQGWRAAGFEERLSDEQVMQMTISSSESSILRDALTTGATVTATSGRIADIPGPGDLPGAAEPAMMIATPLVVRGKTAAVLYADSGAGSVASMNVEAIETLMRVAAMAIELLPARRGSEPTAAARAESQPAAPEVPPVQSVPLPVAAAESTVEPSVETEAAQDAAQSAVEPVAEEVPAAEETAGEAAGAAVSETEKQPAEQSEGSDEREQSEAQHPEAAEVESSAGYEDEEDKESEEVTEEESTEVTPAVVAEVERIIPPAPPAPPTPPLPASMQETRITREFFPTGPIVAPPAPSSEERVPSAGEIISERTFEGRRGTTQDLSMNRTTEQPTLSRQLNPQELSGEVEQRAHNDARRFARLLVSEIKLYNLTKVSEGRRNSDIYVRLSEEIERSRRVYDRRVSPAVAMKCDYFHEELVQTLAEGDSEKLGSEYPGARVN